MRRVVTGAIVIGAAASAVALLSAMPAPQAGIVAPIMEGAPTAVQEGHRLFQQNCSLCHVPTAHAADAYGPKLQRGLVAGDQRQQTRELILKGSAPLMPGFQYSFTPAQIDAVLAYLGTIDPANPFPRVTVKPVATTPPTPGNQVFLTGNVKSARGENMEGVTLFARGEGETITTSVYTDKDGNYYFPAMAGGTYHVWAQAIGFEAGRAKVTTSGPRQRQDFQLKDTANFMRQMTGGQLAAALPVDTPHHRRMRDIFLHTCTTCHTVAYTLQNRFDEAGWDAIITRMLPISGSGTDGGTPDVQMKHYQQELAKYLAEISGPGHSPLKLTVPARPTGAATLPVVYQYAVPLEEYGGYNLHDGTDWSLGTPAHLGGVLGVHDAQIDFNGNIWFTHFSPNKTRSYGRIDARTGVVTDFTAPGNSPGFGAETHGMMRAADGNMWMTVDRQGVGLVDVKTGKMDVFKLPPGIRDRGIDVDWDAKGYVWTGADNGAARLDPKTREWKYFKAQTPGRTYGVAGDRNGTGWWAQIDIDTLGYSDGTTVKEFKVPRNTNGKYISEKDLTPADLDFYNKEARLTSSTFAPWSQGPRRMGADKTTDDLWVSMFNGSNLMRLNTKTLAYKMYALPGTSLNTYMPAIDSNHDVWVSSQGDDALFKFDPKTEQFTAYQWPTRGVAQRHNAVSDRNGVIEVVTAYFGTGNIGRMVMRTEKDLQELKAQAASAGTSAQSNPFREGVSWGGSGKAWGHVIAVAVDRRDNVWVLDRCGSTNCIGSNAPPILKFDSQGNFLKSFGEGLFVLPHSIYVDSEDSVWVTDAQADKGKGVQIIKFSQDGKELMRLGKAGVIGNGPDTFNAPTALVVAKNGDIFVTDGHNGSYGTGAGSRVMKFSKDGKLIKMWGKAGSGPGEFKMPHGIAMDSTGRLFVADRYNDRVQIFDQEGTLLDEWRQFGRPVDVFIDAHDVMYVTDSDSEGPKQFIYIASAKDGKIVGKIPPIPLGPGAPMPLSNPERVVLDSKGNMYAAESRTLNLRKYVRK